jgi:Sulfotransferase family
VTDPPREPRGPVAIGGIGGSGTRVVAVIAASLGFYMGGDLNTSCDNLWFTLMFRRPAWFSEQTSRGSGGIRLALDVFERAMTGTLAPEPDVLELLRTAAGDLEKQGRSRLWVEQRVDSLLRSPTLFPRAESWGWKEPNTHIYLEHLRRYFGDRLRYVHVIRHGLDMAWSDNQLQLRRWAPLFGIDLADVDPTLPDSIASASLDFWIEANERAVSLGRRLLGDRFLVVNFDDLCADPLRGVETICRFLVAEPERSDLALLAKLPRRPVSSGRYREKGLSSFTPDQLHRVASLGFDIGS